MRARARARGEGRGVRVPRAQLAFTLMNPQHTIHEAEEDSESLLSDSLLGASDRHSGISPGNPRSPSCSDRAAVR